MLELDGTIWLRAGDNNWGGHGRIALLVRFRKLLETRDAAFAPTRAFAHDKVKGLAQAERRDAVPRKVVVDMRDVLAQKVKGCLLYTSDAADEHRDV